MNEKCQKIKDIDFDKLEAKRMDFVEVKADLEKEQRLIQERVDSLNRKIYNEFMSINKTAEMYGLNQHMFNNNEQEKCCPLTQKGTFFERNKNTIIVCSLVLLVMVLALGISPTGGFWDVLQTSYVELLVDMFRMGAIAIIFVLVYNLYKK